MKRILSLCAIGALSIAVLAAPATASDFGTTPHRLTHNDGATDFNVGDDSVALGSKLVFRQVVSNVDGLWITDGSVAGTKHLVGTQPGEAPTGPNDFTAFGGKVYFSAYDSVHGNELWVTDGTDAGTKLATPEIRAGVSDSDPEQLTVAGDALYFVASPSSGVKSLYKFVPPPVIGPPAPLQPVLPAITGVVNLKAVGSKVAFGGFTSGSGYEPWISNGTGGGTLKLREIAEGATGSAVGNFITVGTTIYFTANDDIHGTELWRSDGTAGSALAVKDLNPGSVGSNPEGLYALGNRLLFAASDAAGHAIWSTDGTSAHTEVLQRVWGGGSGGNPTGFTAYGGWVYFNGYTGSVGAQLWRTQGTASTTKLFKTIYPGNQNASPQGFTYVDGKLYFSAKDAHGTELWRTDGSSSGTVRISDISPHGADAYPEALVAVRNTLFFTATEPDHGRELYAFTTRSSSTKAYPSSSYSHSSGLHKTIHLTVKVSATGTTPTGTVQLRIGSTVIGSGTLSSGKVSVHITHKLGRGTHHVRTHYLGSVRARASHTGTFSVKVRS